MVVCEIVGTIVSVDGEKKTVEVDIGIPVVLPGHVFGQPRPHIVNLQVTDLNQLREAGKLLYEKAVIVGSKPLRPEGRSFGFSLQRLPGGASTSRPRCFVGVDGLGLGYRPVTIYRKNTQEELVVKVVLFGPRPEGRGCRVVARKNTGDAVQVTISKHERTPCPTL